MMTDRLFRRTRAVTLVSARKIASSSAKSADGSAQLALRNLPCNNDTQPNGRCVKSFEWPTEGEDDGASLPFRFLYNVAIADVAFEARGRTLPSLFESCSRALTEVKVDRRSVRPRKVERITLTSDSTENLLYDFLTDVIIRKCVEYSLFKELLVSR